MLDSGPPSFPMTSTGSPSGRVECVRAVEVDVCRSAVPPPTPRPKARCRATPVGRGRNLSGQRCVPHHRSGRLLGHLRTPRPAGWQRAQHAPSAQVFRSPPRRPVSLSEGSGRMTGQTTYRVVEYAGNKRPAIGTSLPRLADFRSVKVFNGGYDESQQGSREYNISGSRRCLLRPLGLRLLYEGRRSPCDRRGQPDEQHRGRNSNGRRITRTANGVRSPDHCR